MVAFRQLDGTTARRPPVTNRRRWPRPRSKARQRSLSRTAGGAPGASLEVGQANAWEDAAHDHCVEHFLIPSQLLVVEVLRRPLEFTQYLSILSLIHISEPTRPY